MYLEDIADLILQELVKEYGNDVSTIIGDRNMPSLVCVCVFLTHCFLSGVKP